MKVKKLTAVVLLSVVSFSMISAQVPRGPQELQTKTITLSKVAFNQSLSGAIGPKVMGLVRGGDLPL